MHLHLKLVPNWPKLAWAARVRPSEDAVLVHHGPCVETAAHWCVEAVWSGSFAEGDFDRTDLVFGTGVRCRGDRVVFVTSGTMMDRLWHCIRGGQVCVSNSLPCLLACADVTLLDDYPGYADDVETMCRGPEKCNRSIPASPCDLHVTYFHNLVWDGSALEKLSKPDSSPDFRCYVDYYDFLVDVARRLKSNHADLCRAHPVIPRASVSRGYDAGAAAAIAREAGCTDTLTIANASSMLPRNDSGREVAQHLGMRCRSFHHTPAAYRLEETIWAAAGRAAGLNLTVFEYPGPLCLFFTGYHGDTMWSGKVLDRSEPCALPTIAGLAMCEFRLLRGVFHCVVPFWGCRKARQIQEITHSAEMSPWTLGADYDRPIPRRILEEAGVPRRTFGTRKKTTTALGSFHWPFSAVSAESFRQYLRQRGVRPPGRGAVWLLRRVRHWDQFVAVNLNHLLGTRWRGLRPYLGDPGKHMIFQWANHELKQRYEDGLRRAEEGDVLRPTQAAKTCS